MSQSELLKLVIAILEQHGIDYMVTGSVVSSLQGEPRASHDVDVVVALRPEAVPALLAAFPSPNFFLPKEVVEDAIRNKSMFNLLAISEGEKVDFWLLTDEAFDRSRFSRKYEESFEGIKMKVSAPEDTILMKLKWAKLAGGSQKQFNDALRVFEVQFGKLDMGYVNHWAAVLGIDKEWNQLKSAAKPA